MLVSRQEQPLIMNNNNNDMIFGEEKNGESLLAWHAGPQNTKDLEMRGNVPSLPPLNSLKALIGTKPTLVEKKPMRFLITDAPRQANLSNYIRDMKRNNVTNVVRVCEPTYIADSELDTAGISLHEMQYENGTLPSPELIIAWLRLVDSTFFKNAQVGDASPAIAVHCVAGLGRAPVMVAIALIEFAGMDPIEAVTFVRSKRRGAITEKQLLYLSGYKRIYQGSKTADSGCACSIL